MENNTGLMEDVNNEGEGDFFHDMSSEFIGYSVIIEEYNKTVYGYMLFNDDILADVWLRNIGNTPVEEEWTYAEAMPFKNSTAYSKENMIDIEFNKLWVSWFLENSIVTALIYQNNHVIGILKDGFKPGWSYNAKKDGPLALALKKTSALVEYVP